MHDYIENITEIKTRNRKNYTTGNEIQLSRYTNIRDGHTVSKVVKK